LDTKLIAAAAADCNGNFAPKRRERVDPFNPNRPAPVSANAGTFRAVADATGEHRVGAFAWRTDGNWTAVDRLGREIGVFPSEQAAIAAILAVQS
jgi:hypothetical protein